ncbi:MAG: class I SAM-dependent methyltransferase [Acidobacteria bacterium]|nr:class I SAM-dependent methyltransferase [Acidobacteriota bacterium]
MYENLVSVYEKIFPLKPVTLSFVQQHLPAPDENTAILDVGCATGELCRALAGSGYNLTGVEPDSAMLVQAKLLSTGDIPFYPLGMKAVGTYFPENSFSSVICLGNTLAHLPGFTAIEGFFNDVARLLKPEGRFIFQLVNFDRLSADFLPEFPAIEGENFRFLRRYRWADDKMAIRFITTLENKSAGTKKTGECLLFPATKSQLEEAFSSSGFAGRQWFGNYKNDPFTPDSPALICVAEMGGK